MSYSEQFSDPLGPHPCWSCGAELVLWTRVIIGGADDGLEVGECRQCFKIRTFFDDSDSSMWPKTTRTWPKIVAAGFADVLSRYVDEFRVAA